MNTADDKLLKSLAARFIEPGAIGIAITGSYSRGMHDRFSDIDLNIFAHELPEDDYTLRLIDGKLVSVKYIRFADELDSLSKPQSAVWSVPGLRSMTILADDTGELARLKEKAVNFQWEPLQPAADKYAVEQLSGCAEEARKIMSGLSSENESKVLYASWGMFKNLSFGVLVQAGLLIPTENRAFSVLEEHFGASHPWTRAFRLSFGMDFEPGIPAYKTRGIASLDLYEQTALLFKNIIMDEHREVIENALQLILEFKNQSNKKS
jgi:predicted nucleotidyltransferase